jgi:serine/threonine protein phosphatase PrpC
MGNGTHLVGNRPAGDVSPGGIKPGEEIAYGPPPPPGPEVPYGPPPPPTQESTPTEASKTTSAQAQELKKVAGAEPNYKKVLADLLDEHGKLPKEKYGEASKRLLKEAGLAEKYLKDYHLAARYYDAAAKLDPNNKHLHFLSGRAYFEAGQKSDNPEVKKTYLGKAAKRLEQSGQVDSGLPEAVRIYRETHKELGPGQGDVGKVRQAFQRGLQRFLELGPSNAPRARKLMVGLEVASQRLLDPKGKSADEQAADVKLVKDFYQKAQIFSKATQPEGEGVTEFSQEKFRLHSEMDRAYHEGLKGTDSSLKEVRKEMRAAVTAHGGASPTAEDVARARTAAGISRDLGENKDLSEDLTTWTQRLRGLPREEMGAQERFNQLGEILKHWVTLRDHPPAGMSATEITNHGMAEVRSAMMSLVGEIDAPDASTSVEQLLSRVIDHDDKTLLSKLSSQGIQEYARAVPEAAESLKKAEAAKDPESRQAGLMESLKKFTELRDEAKVGEIVDAIDRGGGDNERLGTVTQMMKVLQGSGLAKEAEVKNLGKFLANRMVANDRNLDDVSWTRNALKAQQFYQAAGDEESLARLTPQFKKVRDRLLNHLHFGDAKDPASKPTDSKERIELASLAVSIDQALLPHYVADVRGTPEGQEPLDAGGLVYGTLNVLQREITRAKDLSPEARAAYLTQVTQMTQSFEVLGRGPQPQISEQKLVEQKKGLLSELDGLVQEAGEKIAGLKNKSPAEQLLQASQILSRLTEAYAPLTQGEKPGLSTEDLAKRLGSLREKIQPILNANVQSSLGEIRVSKETRQAMAADLQSHLEHVLDHALKSGDTSVLAGVNSQYLETFAGKLQKAHQTLDAANGAKGSEVLDKSLAAAQAFGELGLPDRVQEALGRVNQVAHNPGVPAELRAEILTMTSHIYRSAGMETESNGTLDSIIALDVEGAGSKVHESAELARGFKALGQGDLSSAAKHFKGLPENDTAQALLEKLEGAQRLQNQGKSANILGTMESLMLSYASVGSEDKDKMPEEEFAARSRFSPDQVKDFIGAAKQLILSGQSPDLPSAIEYLKKSPRYAGFDEAFFGTNSKLKLDRALQVGAFAMSDADQDRQLLGMARQYLDEENYSAAMQLANRYVGDEKLGDEAKKFVSGVPDQIFYDSLVRELKNASVVFAENPKEAAISLGTMVLGFGVGKIAAVGVKGAMAVSAAEAIEASLKLGVDATRVAREAQVFKYGIEAVSMTANAGATAATNSLIHGIQSGQVPDLKSFGKEFGSMMMLFGMGHVAGGAVARLGGGPVSQYFTGVGTFVASKYVDPMLGLKPPVDQPFWKVVVQSFVEDLSMKGGGFLAHHIPGVQGRESQAQRATQHMEVLPKVAELGYMKNGELTPGGMHLYQGLMGRAARGGELPKLSENWNRQNLGEAAQGLKGMKLTREAKEGLVMGYWLARSGKGRLTAPDAGQIHQELLELRASVQGALKEILPGERRGVQEKIAYKNLQQSLVETTMLKGWGTEELGELRKLGPEISRALEAGTGQIAAQAGVAATGTDVKRLQGMLFAQAMRTAETPKHLAAEIHSAADKATRDIAQGQALEAAYAEGHVIIPDGKGGHVLKDSQGAVVRSATAEEQSHYLRFLKANRVAERKGAEVEAIPLVKQKGTGATKADEVSKAAGVPVRVEPPETREEVSGVVFSGEEKARPAKLSPEEEPIYGGVYFPVYEIELLEHLKSESSLALEDPSAPETLAAREALETWVKDNVPNDASYRSIKDSLAAKEKILTFGGGKIHLQNTADLRERKNAAVLALHQVAQEMDNSSLGQDIQKIFLERVLQDPTAEISQVIGQLREATPAIGQALEGRPRGEGRKIGEGLIRQFLEGKIDSQDIRRASAKDISLQRQVELEGQLGISSDDWLPALAKDGTAFRESLRRIDVTRQSSGELIGRILEGQDRGQIRTELLANLKQAGVTISTDTGKAIDSMIDLTLTAKAAGIVDVEGGLTQDQMASLFTTLYLHQSPAVRIGAAELTHVPMVVQATLDIYRKGASQATPSEKRVAFVTALFHDAGKFEGGELRTMQGFTVNFSSFLNNTGIDLKIRPGENLKEGVERLSQDPATLQEIIKKRQEARSKLEAEYQETQKAREDTDNVDKAFELDDKLIALKKKLDAAPLIANKAQAAELLRNLPLLHGPNFLVGVIAHHDAQGVHEFLQKNLVAQGMLNSAEAAQAWQSIERHGLVSSWILNNSLGGIGVLSHVFTQEAFQDFITAYRDVANRMQAGKDVDLGENSTDPAVQTSRRIFSEQFGALDAALLLGDHQGQIDIAKYMGILSAVPANKDASVHQLLLGGNPTTNVDGVIQTHTREQQALMPQVAKASKKAFDAADAWLRNMNPETPGLARALMQDESTRSIYEEWKSQKESEDTSLETWLKSETVKDDHGRLTPEFQAIQTAVEKGFYQHYALSETGRAEFQWAPEVEVAAAHPSERPTPRLAQFPPPLDAVESVRIPRDTPNIDRGDYNLEMQKAHFFMGENKVQIEGGLKDHFAKIRQFLQSREDPALQAAIVGIEADINTLRQEGLGDQTYDPVTDRLKRVAVAYKNIQKAQAKGMDSSPIFISHIVGEYSLNRAETSQETKRPPAPSASETLRPGAAAGETVRPGRNEAGTVRPGAVGQETIRPTRQAAETVRPMRPAAEASPPSEGTQGETEFKIPKPPGIPEFGTVIPMGRGIASEASPEATSSEDFAKAAGADLRSHEVSDEGLPKEEEVSGVRALPREATEAAPSRSRVAREAVWGASDESKPGLIERFGVSDENQQAVLSLMRRATAQPELDLEAETQRLGEVLDVLNDELIPQIKYLSAEEIKSLKETLFLQVMEGNMTQAEAREMAREVRDGEFHIEVLKPEEAEGEPYLYMMVKSETPPRGSTTPPRGPRTEREGEGFIDAELLPNEQMEEAQTRVQEYVDGKMAWVKDLGQAEKSPALIYQVAAQNAREAVGQVEKLTVEIDKTLESIRAMPPESSPERNSAIQNLKGLQGELQKNLDLLQKWENYPVERDMLLSDVVDMAMNYELDATKQVQFQSRLNPEAPKGVPILDVAYQYPPYGADFIGGPGKAKGDYGLVIRVENKADQEALLRQVRMEHAEHRAEFEKDADGKVRSVKMTTSDGRIFSVRVEVASVEQKAIALDRNGVAAATHVGLSDKDYNEDTQEVLSFANGRTLAMVGDGMGGAQGGDVAAKIFNGSFNEAIRRGESPRAALEFADRAVKDYGEGLVQQKIAKGWDPERARGDLPGIVGIISETVPRDDGSYSLNFNWVGDSEAVVLDFNEQGNLDVVFRTHGKNDAEVRALRLNPDANIVDQAMGGHYKTGRDSLDIQSRELHSLQKNALVLMGSDGAFENYLSHAEMVEVIQNDPETSKMLSDAKATGSPPRLPSQFAEKARDVLMRDILIRQRLKQMQEGPDPYHPSAEPLQLTANRYRQAYLDVTGREAPQAWRGRYEGLWVDRIGNVGETQTLGTVTGEGANGIGFRYHGVVPRLADSHFKTDNATLLVQQIGEPVSGEMALPSKTAFVRDQIQLARSIASQFGMEENREFMNDMVRLVSQDIMSVGKGIDPKQRTELIQARAREAKQLAQKYGLGENQSFLKIMGKLLVDNIHGAEQRFGEPVALRLDPALTSTGEPEVSAARKAPPLRKPGQAISPPPPSRAMPEVAFPRPPATPTGLEEKEQFDLGLYNRVYPEPGGRPLLVGSQMVEELESMTNSLASRGHPEIADKMTQDMKTAHTAKVGSPEYEAALSRLAKALDIRRHDSDFASAPVDFMGDVKLGAFAQRVEDIYSTEAKTELAPRLSLVSRPSAEPASPAGPAPEAEEGFLRAASSERREGEVSPEEIVKPPTPEVSGERSTFRPPAFLAGPAAALLAGAGVLFPRAAEAAPLHQHIDSVTEAYKTAGVTGAIVAGFALAVGVPLYRRYVASRENPILPVSSENPVRTREGASEFTIQPFSRQDMRSNRAIDGIPARISLEGSVVIGDEVRVAFVGGRFDFSDPKNPKQIEVASLAPLTFSREEAQRLGIKFDKRGDILEVPKGEVLIQENVRGDQEELGIPISEAARKTHEPVWTQFSQVHGSTRMRPFDIRLDVAEEKTKEASPLKSYARVSGIEVDRQRPGQVGVQVEVYDPSDPAASPTNLMFSIANPGRMQKPEVVEKRVIWMSVAEGKAMGIERGKLSAEKLFVMEDQPNEVTTKKALAVMTNERGGYLISSPKNFGRQVVVEGTFASVDRVSFEADKVHVWFMTSDLPGKKGKRLSMDPVTMSLAEARQLGILPGYSGKTRIQRNEFFLQDFSREVNGQLVIEGKAVRGTVAGMDLRIEEGKDGRMQMGLEEAPLVLDLSDLKDKPPPSSGRARQMASEMVPRGAAYSVGAPVGIFTALTAHGVDPKIAFLAAGVSALFTPSVLGGIFNWGKGGIEASRKVEVYDGLAARAAAGESAAGEALIQTINGDRDTAGVAAQVLVERGLRDPSLWNQLKDRIDRSSGIASKALQEVDLSRVQEALSRGDANASSLLRDLARMGHPEAKAYGSQPDAADAVRKAEVYGGLAERAANGDEAAIAALNQIIEQGDTAAAQALVDKSLENRSLWDEGFFELDTKDPNVRKAFSGIDFSKVDRLAAEGHRGAMDIQSNSFLSEIRQEALLAGPRNIEAGKNLSGAEFLSSTKDRAKFARVLEVHIWSELNPAMSLGPEVLESAANYLDALQDGRPPEAQPLFMSAAKDFQYPVKAELSRADGSKASFRGELSYYYAEPKGLANPDRHVGVVVALRHGTGGLTVENRRGERFELKGGIKELLAHPFKEGDAVLLLGTMSGGGNRPGEPGYQAPQVAASVFSPKVGEAQLTGHLASKVEVSAEQVESMLAEARRDARVAFGEEPILSEKTGPEGLHITLLDANEAASLMSSLVQNYMKEHPEASLSKGKQRDKGRELLKAKIEEVRKSSGVDLSGEGLTVTGVGKSEGESEQVVYYGTVEWPGGQGFRKALGLKPKDFHITLASTASQENGNPLDIHGVPKNEPNVVRFAPAELKNKVASDEPPPSGPQTPPASPAGTTPESGPTAAAAATLAESSTRVSLEVSVGTRGFGVKGRSVLEGMVQGFLDFISPKITNEGKMEAPPSSQAGRRSPEELILAARRATSPAQKARALVRILENPEMTNILSRLDQISSQKSNNTLLEDLLPGLAEKSKLTQDPRFYGNRTVKEQVLYDLQRMEGVLRDQTTLDPVLASRAPLLRMVSLFLDMGKHADPTLSPKGLRQEVEKGGVSKLRFLGYENFSAQLFEQFARNEFNPQVLPENRFSEADITLGRHLIERHLDAIKLLNSFPEAGQQISDKALRRFVHKIAYENKELLRQGVSVRDSVHLALNVMDSYLRSTENYPGKDLMLEKFGHLVQEVNQRLPDIEAQILKEKTHTLVDGKDIQALAEKAPNPLPKKEMGQLMNRVKDLVYQQQIEGLVTNREAALKLARQVLAETLTDLPKDPAVLQELISKVEIPKHLLGINLATERIIQDAQGNEVARIRYYKANPVPQFHGEIDPTILTQNIQSGLYPTLQRSFANGDLNVGHFTQALQEKGFRNLAEIELFLADPSDRRGPKEKLEGVGRASAPTAPLVELTREFQGKKITVRIGRGWEGSREHLGSGGIHLAAQRAQELGEMYRRPGETHEQMLARFMEDITMNIVGTSNVVLPSERNPNFSILLGPSSNKQEFGAVVVDRSDPKNWKVVTTMFQPNAAKMRSGIAAPMLRLMWRTPGEDWGKETPSNPIFQKAMADANRLLTEHGQTPLSLAEVTPEEFKPFQELTVRNALKAKVEAAGIQGKAAHRLVQDLFQQVQQKSSTTEAALEFMEGKVVSEILAERAPKKIEKIGPAVPYQEVLQMLKDFGIQDKKEIGRHMVAIRSMKNRNQAMAYLDGLRPEEVIHKAAGAGTRREIAPEETAHEEASGEKAVAGEGRVPSQEGKASEVRPSGIYPKELPDLQTLGERAGAGDREARNALQKLVYDKIPEAIEYLTQQAMEKEPWAIEGLRHAAVVDASLSSVYQEIQKNYSFEVREQGKLGYLVKQEFAPETTKDRPQFRVVNWDPEGKKLWVMSSEGGKIRPFEGAGLDTGREAAFQPGDRLVLVPNVIEGASGEIAVAGERRVPRTIQGSYYEATREIRADGSVWITARPRVEGAGLGNEGDLSWIAKNHPELAEKLAITVNPDGSVTYPDIDGLNQRLKDHGFGFRFWAPTDEELKGGERQSEAGQAKFLDTLEHLAKDPPEFPLALWGSEHFHDLGIHLLGYLALPSESLKQISETAKTLSELLSSPEFKGEGPARDALMRAMETFIDGGIEVHTGLLTQSIKKIEGYVPSPDSADGMHANLLMLSDRSNLSRIFRELSGWLQEENEEHPSDKNLQTAMTKVEQLLGASTPTPLKILSRDNFPILLNQLESRMGRFSGGRPAQRSSAENRREGQAAKLRHPNAKAPKAKPKTDLDIFDQLSPSRDKAPPAKVPVTPLEGRVDDFKGADQIPEEPKLAAAKRPETPWGPGKGMRPPPPSRSLPEVSIPSAPAVPSDLKVRESSEKVVETARLPSEMVPQGALYSVAGPAAIYATMTAHGVDPKIAFLAAGVSALFTPGVLGAIFNWGKGGEPPQQTPPHLVLPPGATRVMIGKNSQNEFVTQEGDSRGIHCTVEKGNDGHWYLTNGSTTQRVHSKLANPTIMAAPSNEAVFLSRDGKNFQEVKLHQWAPLREGDVVKVGAQSFTFKAPAPESRSSAQQLPPLAQPPSPPAVAGPVRQAETATAKKQIELLLGRSRFTIEIHDENKVLWGNTVFGHIVNASPHPRDSNRIQFELEATRGLYPEAPKNKLTVQLSREQAADLNILLTPEGRLDTRHAVPILRIRQTPVGPDVAKPAAEVPGGIHSDSAPRKATAKTIEPLAAPLPLQESAAPAKVSPLPELGELSYGQPGQKIDWSHREEDWGGIAAASDKGRDYKDHNEDRYVKVAFADGRTLMVAIDGMGGHSGGEPAAEYARAALELAARRGKTPEEALQSANAAVYQYSKSRGFVKPDGKLRREAPGAVALAVEVTPQTDGTYKARFLKIGDCEAVVLRPGGKPPVIHHTNKPTRIAQALKETGQSYQLLPDGRLARGQTLDFRRDPQANIVEACLGGDAVQTPLDISSPDQALRAGDIVLTGSDGFFENFGSLDIVNHVVAHSGAKSASEIRDVLMQEALIRMSLMKHGSGKMLDHQVYIEAYRGVNGREPPPGWRGMYEPYQDAQGQRHAYSLDHSGDLRHISSRKVVDHFKNDNVTLMVQVLGAEVKPDLAAPPGGRVIEGPWGTGPAKSSELPTVPVLMSPPANVTREGQTVGLLVGGSWAEGQGRLVPKDGTAKRVGEGWEIRFNPQAESYEYRRTQGGNITPWREIAIGQRMGDGGQNFSLTELQGVLQGENNSNQNIVSDLQTQVDYQLATDGVKNHLQALANEGISISAVDAQNLSLFFHPDFKRAMNSYDSGQHIRTQGGLAGGSSTVYALVDPITGRIHRFASRNPKTDEARSNPRWELKKDTRTQRLVWIDQKGQQPPDLVNPQEVPPGAVVVPLTIERMTGRVLVDSKTWPGLGLSATAQRTMKNIDGFFSQLGGAAIPALMNYAETKGRTNLEEAKRALAENAVPLAEKFAESPRPGLSQINANKGVGRDLASFMGAKPSLVEQHRIPGLTADRARKLEGIFEEGGYIVDFGRGPIIHALSSGAHTIETEGKASETDQAFHKLWQQERGFSPLDPATSRQPWAALQARARALGIEIRFGTSPDEAVVNQKNLQAVSGQIAYINDLLQMLPDSMLKNPKLQGINLNTERVGAGKLSSFENNRVYLFSGTFSGDRRHLAGMLLHELGHSTAERYLLGTEGDPSISEAVRQKMHQAHQILVKNRAMLGLDHAGGPKYRRSYQAQFEEFLAEMNLNYVAAGPMLRQHIQQYPEGSEVRKAWDFVYHEMQHRIFAGREYGYLP